MRSARVPIGTAQIRVLLGLLAVYGEHGRATVRTVGLAIGEYLASRTGLPIDFQIQRNTEANERHHGVRNPLGHTRQLANYRGDAAPEADDDR